VTEPLAPQANGTAPEVGGPAAAGDYEILLRLPAAVRRAAQQRAFLLDLKAQEYRMAALYSRLFWDELRRTYALPEDMEYDPAEGVIFRRVPSSPAEPPAGAEPPKGAAEPARRRRKRR
jgi:hypothetical protein